jgi:truncated hemoglobin YjbI
MKNVHQQLRDINRCIVDVEISIERTEATIFRRKHAGQNLETASFERVLQKLLASLENLHEKRQALRQNMLVILAIPAHQPSAGHKDCDDPGANT